MKGSGATADKAQRDNWAQSDYERGIADLAEERDDLDAMARALAKEAAQRFGKTPEIAPLPKPSNGDE
jgi:hypothetical protein